MILAAWAKLSDAEELEFKRRAVSGGAFEELFPKAAGVERLEDKAAEVLQLLCGGGVRPVRLPGPVHSYTCQLNLSRLYHY